MKEMKVDLFTGNPDAICILTNGVLNKHGCNVMGAGNAKQCKELYPGAPKQLGDRIKKHGNITQPFMKIGKKIVFAFPTKNNWRGPSDIELIKRSCIQLMAWINKYNLKKVWLPRPGVGMGRLKWNDVKKEIEPLLDDRVVVVTK